MAFFKETYTAEDELDYEVSTGATVGITRADAKKGIAARFNTAQTTDSGRPEVAKANAASQVILGAITFVGPKGCNVVKSGRFVLQAASAYAAGDFGKSVESTTTLGKVEATSAAATQGQLCIIGGGEDTGGIGDFYLVERI